MFSYADIRSAVRITSWDAFQNFLFVVPAIVIFGIFYMVPFINLIWLSLHSWPGIGPMSWVGLQNFQELAHDKVWWASMWNAGYITLIALIFQNALALALALACDREIRMRRFYRIIFFIPPVLSEIVVGILWSWILYAGQQDGQQLGLFNHFLVQIGLPNLVHHWLSDPQTALTCVAIVHAWKGFGWGFIILLAGLQTIDRRLYEAARIDGASSWRIFWNITIPMVLPVIMVVMVLTILGSMQVFVLIMSLVGQGLVHHTDVPVIRILDSMQVTKQFGYACAQAVIFGFVLIGASFSLKHISKHVKQV